MSDDLGPPPPPRPVQMPPMPASVAQRAGVPAGAAPAGAPMMAGMPMMAGGCPTVGGMGPNLVFNFCSSPYGMGMLVPAPPAADQGEGDGEEKEKTVIVQGDPTWCKPRRTAKKGSKVKDEPCIIM